MNPMRYYVMIVVAALMITSCDCVYEVSGVVLNSETNKPIENVVIGNTIDPIDPYATYGKSLTNNHGFFEASGISGICNSVMLYFSHEGFETQKLTFKNYASDTVYLRPTAAKTNRFFNQNAPFVVQGLIQVNDYPSSDKDTDQCEDWNPSPSAITKALKASRPITGHEWHYYFDHLPCAIEGHILQNGEAYDLAVNGGSWFTISSQDTSVSFGSFDKEINSLFLSTPMNSVE